MKESTGSRTTPTLLAAPPSMDFTEPLPTCTRPAWPSFAHPVCLLPAQLWAPSTWWGHVPFARSLVALQQPKCFVELGTYAGVSYSAFCETVAALQLPTQCYAIDTWQGDVHGGQFGDSVFRTWRQFHDTHFALYSKLLRMPFDTAVDRFADGSIDLLHIDGFHSRAAVEHDFLTWLPKLSDRGVVLFHDITERSLPGFGVYQFWEEVRQWWPHFEFEHAHGLGLLCVGQDVPAALLELCSAAPKQQQICRSFYTNLGQLFVDQAECRLSLQSRQAENNHLHAHIGRLEQVVSDLQQHLYHRELQLQQTQLQLAGLQETLQRWPLQLTAWLADHIKSWLVAPVPKPILVK